MTVHRDALAAAQARIAALEAALDEARGGAPTDDALRSEIARLEMLLSAAHAERRVAEERADTAEEELGRIRAEQARIERVTKKDEREAARAARGGTMQRDLRSMLTLDQHNRSLPEQAPTENWRPAGVLCPACAEDGQRAELGEAPITQRLGSMSLVQVVCVRCGFVGAKRAR